MSARAQVAGGGSAHRNANYVRGEASLPIAGRPFLLRPSFAALVERAGEGRLRLAELATLFWHCLAERGETTRDEVGEAVIELGLAGCAAPLRILLGQILRGRA
jgi:hypothetical protein